METISRCWLIQIFFYLIVSNKIISKIDKETESIMPLLAYVGLYYLLGCDYPLQYEVWLTVLHYIFYEDSSIAVDILAHFNKSLEQFNKYKFSSKKQVVINHRETSYKRSFMTEFIIDSWYFEHLLYWTSTFASSSLICIQYLGLLKVGDIQEILVNSFNIQLKSNSNKFL